MPRADEYQAFLRVLTKSANVGLREQAHSELAKFNPLEPRLPTGQWTATGTTGTISRKPTAQERQAEAADQRARTQAAHQSDATQLGQAQDRLSRIKLPATPKGGAAAAAQAQRKALGIPSGKQFKRLPPARQAAANQVLTAAADTVRLRGAAARVQARIDAITKETQAEGLRPATRAWLGQQLDRANAKLAAIGQQRQAATANLTAGRKAWRRGR